MNTVTVNGITITTSGKSIYVNNGKIIVDGEDVTPDAKVINISVIGQVDKIQADSCSRINITGDAGNIRTQTGDIEVGGNIAGDAQSQTGDINCNGAIGGKVSTMTGDIKYRK